MSELIIIQPESLDKYKTISLTATEDPELSWAAKGLHTYLISRPPGWKVYYADLLNRAKCGRDKLRNLLDELEARGYVVTEQTRNEATQRFNPKTYKVFHEPQAVTEKPATDTQERKARTGNPEAAPPEAAEPSPENPPLSIKDSSREEDTKEQETNSQSYASPEILPNPYPTPLRAEATENATSTGMASPTGGGMGAEMDEETKKALKAEAAAIKQELTLGGLSRTDAHALLMREGVAATRKLMPVLFDLMAAGIDPTEAQALISEKGTMACKLQLEWLPYRTGIDSPRKYLLWAIRNKAPEPKGVPITVQVKAEVIDRTAALALKPAHEIDTNDLPALGARLWPHFVAAVDAGLTELTVSGPPHPKARLEAGIYPITQDGDRLYVTMPTGSKVLLQEAIIALFNWPGKGGVGVAA